MVYGCIDYTVLDAEEQRQSLGSGNQEHTCADDHHDRLLDVLLLVVHLHIHGDGTDDGHDTCNGIAELGGDGDVLGNLLRSLADGVLTSLVACTTARLCQGCGNIEGETHGDEDAEAYGTAVLYKVASTLAAIL